MTTIDLGYRPREWQRQVHLAMKRFTVLALHHQKVPPTINLDNPDPECDLDYCANTARDMKIDVALKNNFGFGGTNASLIVGQPD